MARSGRHTAQICLTVRGITVFKGDSTDRAPHDFEIKKRGAEPHTDLQMSQVRGRFDRIIVF